MKPLNVHFFMAIFIVLLLLTPSIIAKKPSEDYIPDPNISITNADDYELRDFIISASQDGNKLKKDKWDWIKRLDKDEFWLENKDDLKYDSEGKLKNPLSNITFRVEPNFLRLKKCISNQYYEGCTYDKVSFDTFKAKNNITSEVITPAYYSNWDAFWEIFFSTNWATFGEFQNFMRTPMAYDITFYGTIDDLDPEINEVYISTSNLFQANQTEASAFGARLDAPVLFMNFNNPPEGTYVQDNSIYNNFGTNNGSTYNASCSGRNYQDDGCFEFDGSSNINLGDFDITSETTISAWVNTATISGGWGGIFSHYTGTSGCNSFGFRIEDDDIQWLPHSSNQVQATGVMTANTWHHVVGTISTSGTTASIYLDGVQVATETDYTEGVQNSDCDTLIGRDYTDRYFNGSIDNVQILDRALSSSEVLNLYNGTINNSDYIGKYSSKGDFQSFVFFNSTKTFWNSTLSIADSDGSGINLTDPNLVSYWALDGNYNDSKGSNHGTPAGTNNATGLSSEAIRFDGVNDYVDFPTSNFGSSTTYAISMWVMPTSTKSNVHLWEGGSLSAPSMEGASATSLKYWVGNTANIATGTLAVGEWHHLVAMYDKATTTQSLYKNGELVGTNDVDVSDTIGATWYLGHRPAGRWYPGVIDEVIIYNDSLAQTEVQSLYKAGLSQHAQTNISLETRTATSYNLTDPNLVGMWSMNEGNSTFVKDELGLNNLTVVGAEISEENGTVGKGYSFDGGTDELQGTGYPSNIFSVSAWFKTDGTVSAYNGILEYTVGTGRLGISLGTSGEPILSFLNGGTRLFKTSTGDDFDDGEWHHMVGTSDGSTTQVMYVDGIEQTLGTGAAATTGASNVLRIGDFAASGFEFKGNIDEVRLYNDTLTEAEIQDLYTLGKTHINWQGPGTEGSTDDLLMYLSMNNNTQNTTGDLVYSQTGIHNATLASGVTFGEGVIESGLNFDGSNGIPSENLAEQMAGATGATMMAWVKHNAESDDDAVLGCWDGSSGMFIQSEVSGADGFTFLVGGGAEITTVRTDTTIWNHVALVYNGSTSTEGFAYINGKMVSNFNGDTNPLDDCSDEFYIGSLGGGLTRFWTGSIDEARYFNRSLSTSEIAEFYELGQQGLTGWRKEPGKLVDGVPFTSGQSGNFFQMKPLMSTNDTNPGVSPYILNHSISGEPIPLAFPIDFSGDTPADGNVSTNDFINISLTTSTEIAETTTFVDFNKELLGWWSFNNDNSSTVFDNSTYSNNGTITGAIINTTNTKFGNAMTFDGGTDHIEMINNAGISGDANMSWSVWMNTNSLTQDQCMASVGDSGAALNIFALCMGLTGSGRVGVAYAGGNTFETAAGTISATDTWYHIVTTKSSGAIDTTTKVYVNGIEIAMSTAPSTTPNINEAMTPRIGQFGNNGLEFNGELDDVMLFNRTLSPSEILSLYNTTDNQYSNNFTGLSAGNYTFQGWTQQASGATNKTETREVELQALPITGPVNTSMSGVGFNVSSFIFDTSTYIEGFAGTFNTSTFNESFVLITSLNVRNAALGAGTVQPFINISVDGVQIVEEQLSTVSWSAGGLDIKATGTPPQNFTVENTGEHNITIEYRRTGTPRPIVASNIDLSLGKLQTEQNGTVAFTIADISGSTSSATLDEIQNFSIEFPGANGTDYYLPSFSLTSDGATDAVCAFFEEGTRISPFIVRTLSATGTGTGALPFFDGVIQGSHNTTLKCLSTQGATVTVAGKFLHFALVDNSNNTVQGFQNSNPNTNWTNTVTYGAGVNLLANDSYTFADNGDSLFIAASVSFNSTAGEINPRFIVNTTLSTDCAQKNRTSGGDVGNMFVYFVCKDSPSKGDQVNITLYVDVPAGASIEVFDESLSGFELKSFDITTTNTPPNVDIVVPLAGDTINGSAYQINYTVTDSQLDSYLTNITLTNSSDVFIIANGLIKGNTTFTFNTELYRNGFYNLTINATENETADGFSGFDTHSIQIINDPSTLTIVEPTGVYPQKDGLSLNITNSKYCLQAVYSLNGGANQTFACSGLSTNTTFSGSKEGMNDMNVSIETGAGWIMANTSFDVNTQNSTLLIFPTENEWETTETITLKGYCRFTNGTVCDSSIPCRFTAHYPNGSILVENAFGSYGAGGVYTYSVGYTNITQNIKGAYSSAMSCYDGQDQEAAFTWWVAIEKNAQVILYSLLFFSVIMLLLIGEWKDNWVFKAMAGMLLLTIGLWIFIYGIGGTTLSFLSSGNKYSWISWISWLLMFTGFGYLMKVIFTDLLGGELQ